MHTNASLVSPHAPPSDTCVLFPGSLTPSQASLPSASSAAALVTSYSLLGCSALADVQLPSALPLCPEQLSHSSPGNAASFPLPFASLQTPPPSPSPAAAPFPSPRSPTRPVAAALRGTGFPINLLPVAVALSIIMMVSTAVIVADAQGTWSTAQLSMRRYELSATSVGNVALFALGYTGSALLLMGGWGEC